MANDVETTTTVNENEAALLRRIAQLEAKCERYQRVLAEVSDTLEAKRDEGPREAAKRARAEMRKISKAGRADFRASEALMAQLDDIRDIVGRRDGDVVEHVRRMAGGKAA